MDKVGDKDKVNKKIADHLPIGIEHKEKLLNNILNSISDLIVFYDDKNIVQYANCKFTSTMGKKRDEIVSKDITDIVKDEQVGLSEHLINIKDENQMFVEKYEVPIIDGGAFLGYLLIYRDIREKKKQEEEIAWQKKVIRQQKLAALGELTSEIAHEVNNPNSIIDGVLRHVRAHLSKENVDFEKIESLIGKGLKASLRIQKIIKFMKKMSRKGAETEDEYAEFEKTSFASIVDETVDWMETKLIKDKIEVVVVNELDDDSVHCNTTQISQVIINLMQNSMDAMNEVKDIETKIINIKMKHSKRI